MNVDTPVRSLDSRRREVEDTLDDLLRLNGEDAGELLLVRHAEAARSQGRDPMLSCTGLRQAELLASRLAYTWFDAVYTAPERRAHQTARVLAGGLVQPVRILEGLSDVDFDEALPGPGESLAGYADRFVERPRWDNLPGFECTRQFRRRAIETVEGILAEHGVSRVVVVTHSSVINAYLSMLLSVPADLFFTAEHTSVSIVRWSEGRYALRCLNDLSHLSPGRETFDEGQLFTLR